MASISKLGISALGVCAFATLASAQTHLFGTDGVVVAKTGDAVPDDMGMPITGFTYGVPSGTSSPFDSPVLDPAGNVLFRSRFIDAMGPIDAWADRALFHGDSSANLLMVARGGQPAPGQCVDVQWRTSNGTTSPLSSSNRLTPDGRLYFGSSLWDSMNGVNCMVSSTIGNDNAVFGGPLGSITTLVQRGDIAPGTDSSMMGMEATFAQAFSSPSQQSTGMNENGVLYMQATLVNGTGVPPVTTTAGMNNQAGIWCGLPGALKKVARKSDEIAGLTGLFALDGSATIGSVTQMNAMDELLYDCVLSTALSTPTITAAEDRVVAIFDYASGLSSKVVQEGDAAPVPGGGNFNAISGDSWSPGFSGNAFTRNGNFIFVCELRGTTGGTGVDDRAVFSGNSSAPSTLSLVARRGTTAPGTGGGLWDGFSTTNSYINAFGQVALQGFLLNDPMLMIDSTNDSGIWAGDPNNLQLVCREGQVMPGSGGSVAGTLSGITMEFNDLCQVILTVNLSGGTTTGSAKYAWEPVFGLMPVYLPGDTVEVGPMDVRTTTGAFSQSGGFNNADGASLVFGHDGTYTGVVRFTDDTNAVMKVKVPTSKTFSTFCFGDGGNQMGCTNCPCGNNAPMGAGGGCLNSNVMSTGAVLVPSGVPDVTTPADTLHFIVNGANTSTFGILTSGDNRLPNNAMNPCFGLDSGVTSVALDGLRCVGGTVIRHGSRSSDANGDIGVTTAGWGPPNGPLAGLGVTNGFVAGQTRHFQVIYRESVLSVCLTGQNTTQGVSVTFF